MRNALSLAVLCLLGAACRGTSPTLNGSPEQGISAVIIGGRIMVANGEARAGGLDINLEGEGAQGEVYRMRVLPRRALLYQVEPGSYRLSPTRSLLGSPEPYIMVRVAGRTYRAPFPREILRESAVAVKPRRIAALGVVEATLSRAMPGAEPSVSVRLDDSLETRRRLVQTLIHNMMDPSVPASERESAISWTHALDQSLQDLLAESERAPLYKLSP